MRLDNLAMKIFGRKVMSIQLDLTNACNLKCSHCYHADHKNIGSLTLSEWSTVLDQYQLLLNALKARPNIAICGGEPLVSPLLEPLLSEIMDRWSDAFIGIMTNGTRVNRMIDRLAKYPLYFQVSLESPNRERHDAIRGKGSFDEAMSGIRLLMDRGFEVSLLVILSRKTRTEIYDMFQLASDLGVHSLNYTRAIPQGAGKSYFYLEDTTLKGKELKEAILDILDASRKALVPTNTEKPLFSILDLSSPGAPASGYDGLIVGYRGEVKISSRADLKIGDIRKDNLKDLFFQNPIFRSLRNGEIIKCGDCKFFRRCGGDRTVAYAESGNFLGPDDGCWL